MMLDAKGCVMILVGLALLGFIGGAIASIWTGPIAMLYGAAGLPVALVLLIALWLFACLLVQR